ARLTHIDDWPDTQRVIHDIRKKLRPIRDERLIQTRAAKVRITFYVGDRWQEVRWYRGFVTRKRAIVIRPDRIDKIICLACRVLPLINVGPIWRERLAIVRRKRNAVLAIGAHEVIRPNVKGIWRRRRMKRSVLDAIGVQHIRRETRINEVDAFGGLHKRELVV